MMPKRPRFVVLPHIQDIIPLVERGNALFILSIGNIRLTREYVLILGFLEGMRDAFRHAQINGYPTNFDELAPPKLSDVHSILKVFFYPCMNRTAQTMSL